MTMIEDVKFGRVNDNFQRKPKADLSSIKESNKIFVTADKTRNMYDLGKSQ